MDTPHDKPLDRRYHHGDLRRSLLAAAEEELAEKGVEGFTLRGCAKRAGVSHAAPAHHFKDAGALLSALAAEGFGRFAAAMAQRQAQVAPGAARDALVAAGLGYLDFAMAHPALLRLMFSSGRPDHANPELKQEAGKAFELLWRSVAAARADDAGSESSLEQDVAATWAIVHGLAELMLSDRLGFVPGLHGDRRDEVAAQIIGRALFRSLHKPV
jgi:AcrR family transcriptional regulator